MLHEILQAENFRTKNKSKKITLAILYNWLFCLLMPSLNLSVAPFLSQVFRAAYSWQKKVCHGPAALFWCRVLHRSQVVAKRHSRV